MKKLFFLNVFFAFSVCALHFFYNDSIKIFHIFFFNLVAGGTVIIYLSEQRKITLKLLFYFLSGIIFAVLAWMKLFYIAFIFPLFMMMITESIRYRLFSIFPLGFFMKDISVMSKFHQAALLCLSISHIIMSVTLLNNHYFNWWYLPKLNFKVFYLGYSFPISLTIISYIMAYLYSEKRPYLNSMKNIIFWVLNLGVITLFLGIITESLYLEVFISIILTIGVILLIYVFWIYFPHGTARLYLLSGLSFLIITAISGILFAILNPYPEYKFIQKYLLKLHAIFSLYGWNLSGLIVVMKTRDHFTSKIFHKTWTFILFHWISLIAAIIGLNSPEITFISIFIFAGALFYTIFHIPEVSIEIETA